MRCKHMYTSTSRILKILMPMSNGILSRMVSCQCHMELLTAWYVDPQVKRSCGILNLG